VNAALDFDFEGCVHFVDKLRNEYFMRLNSNYLLTKAIHHPKRVEFNQTHPLVLKNAIESVGCLPTDWTTQYKLLKESRKPIPTIWKRAIADKLQKMTAYHAAKYLHGSKTDGKVRVLKLGNVKISVNQEPEFSKKNLANLVDLIRITHPTPTDVTTQLVKNGKVNIADDEQTWEKLRSAKKTWQEINQQIRLPHMALLRNLRNIIQEYAEREDTEAAIKEIESLTEQLVGGVRGGKQFPFRYFSAYKMLKSANPKRNKGNNADIDDSNSDSEDDEPVRKPPLYKGKGKKAAPKEYTENQIKIFGKMVDIVLAGLNKCVLESVESIPPMKGRVDCLSDNSGSSRGGIVSEYGTVNVYEIANLSAILTAYRATGGGSVWVFGDKLKEYVVTKEPILDQLENVNDLGETVGGGTETGVWLFWEKFILAGNRLDTVFIYSDMQAGTGELFVDGRESEKLKQMGGAIDDGTYVDVLKLVQIYRGRVNPKVNVFSVQVAGYDNSILPDILYRGAILSGWTGKEAKLAYEMSELWDSIEEQTESA
jgi:polyhydroxyalkanoate synthesis regulator phasin